MGKIVNLLPRCCGQEMAIQLETSLYYEVHCKKCGDTIYVKKEHVQKPQMLDD